MKFGNRFSLSADNCKWNGCPAGYNLRGSPGRSRLSDSYKTGYLALELWDSHGGRVWVDDQLMRDIVSFVPTYAAICRKEEQRALAGVGTKPNPFPWLDTPEKMRELIDREGLESIATIGPKLSSEQTKMLMQVLTPEEQIELRFQVDEILKRIQKIRASENILE